VRKYDNNNAARKKIIVRQVKPTVWTGNVLLSRNNTKVKVFDAATGGTEITFNGTDNKFTNSSLPEPLWVEGYSASGSMRDVALELGVETPPPSYKDKVKFTVLWATVSTDHTGSLETDNASRDAYSNLVVPPPCYTLGYHLFCTYSSDFTEQRYWNGRGSEFMGNMVPPNFVPSQFSTDPHVLHLAREIVSGNTFHGYNGYEWTDPVSTGDDTSGPPCRDDDPQSGGSPGVIYDHDSSGYNRYLVPANWIIRKRANYREWAEWGGTRCSLKKSWFTRQSYKKTGSADSGTASSGTANTLTDNSKGWGIDFWEPGAVVIVSGTGGGQVRRVTSNTADTITVTNNWSITPDNTSGYEVINTSTWTLINDVASDNKNADGTTNITWNLE